MHIHHLDGNNKNDIDTNKIVLCANCHLSYHQNCAWDLESIGIITPIEYINPKNKKRKIIPSSEELLEIMRTELDKHKLIIIPNKENKI